MRLLRYECCGIQRILRSYVGLSQREAGVYKKVPAEKTADT